MSDATMQLMSAGPPTVTGLSPEAGTTAGGTSVTVTGTNFVTGSTTVAFGQLAGSAVNVVSSTQLTVVSPAGSPSLASVIATTPNGSSTTGTPSTYEYVTPGPYVPVTVTRICDTRSSQGTQCAGKTLQPNSTLNVPVSGMAGVPTTAAAVYLNLTDMGPTGTTSNVIAVYPYGLAAPAASNLDVATNANQGNLVEVPLGQQGEISVYNETGTTDIAIDVEGYVAASPSSPPTGAKAYWKFDENTWTTAADATGGGHTATFSGATPYWTTGKINSGANLNGADALSVSSVDLSSTAQVSISFWWNYGSAFPTSLDGIAQESTWGSGNAFWLGINAWTAGKIELATGSSTYNIVDYTPPGTGWHHYVAVLDRTLSGALGGMLYIDGVAAVPSGVVSSHAVGGNFTNSGINLGGSGSQYDLTGSLDEVGLWGRALASGEVAAMYNFGGGLQYPFTGASSTAGLINLLSPSAGLCDTLPNYGTECANKGAFGSGESRTIQVDGQAGIPASGVQTAVIDLSVLPASSGGGYFIIWPTGISEPFPVSFDIYGSNDVSERVIVPVGPSGQVTVYNSGPGTANVVMDAFAYTTDGSSSLQTGQDLVDQAIARACDTRSGSGYTCAGKSLTANTTQTYQLGGLAGIPLYAPAVAINIAMMSPASGVGDVTIWPTGTTKPGTTDLLSAGANIANFDMIVGLGSGGQINVVSTVNSDLVIDVEGVYMTPPGSLTPVTAVPGDGHADVQWQTPAAPGNLVGSYTITPYIGTTAQMALVQSDTFANSQGVATTSYGVPGLTDGTAYTFQVTATNAAGNGPPGTSNLVTPAPPPAYDIAGTGGSTSSPVVLAPAKGYDNGASPQDGTRPQQVAVAGLRGTGWQDIVTANGSSVSALTSQKSTNGTFAQPAVVSSVSGGASHVAVGNLFGHTNGVLDAVAVNGTSTITVLEGSTNGSLAPMHAYSIATGTANEVALADVNGDGHLDIVTAGGRPPNNAQATEVAVLLGNGDGTFGAATEYLDNNQGPSNSYSATGLAVADLNGDGRPDIVEVVDEQRALDTGVVYVRLNHGDGTFGSTGTEANVGGLLGAHSLDGNEVVIGDFTGNGVNDIAALVNQSGGGARGITLLLGNGDGTFAPPVNYRDPALEDASGIAYGQGTGIAVDDMNGDGVPDIVTSDNGSVSGVPGISVYLATGTTSGMDLPVFLPTPSFTPEGIALGNVHSSINDGRADVVVENNGTTSPGAPANVEVLVNGTDFPPLGSALGPNEMHGCLMCQALQAGTAINVNGNWPITVNSGEMSHTFTDISIPARGYPLQVTQTYNSLNAGSSATDDGLGYGWWSPLFMSVTQNSSSGITTVTQEDGAQAQFYTANLAPVAPRTEATLVHNGDGTWSFTRYGGNTFTFNASGQITKLQDLTGDYLSFGYGGAPSVVTSVTHADGRSLSIAWSNGDIASITDSNVTGQTRTVSFTYGTSTHAHELAQIDWKVNGSNDRNEQFAYDETTWVHGLASMQDPDGHVVAQTYNSDGTTATQTVDPSGLNRVTSYSYWPARTSTYSSMLAALITDPAGHQEIDEFAYGELVQTTTGFTGCSTTLSGTWPTGTGCNSSNIATTTRSFDPSSIGATLTIDPNRNLSSSAYDSRGNVLSATDAMGRTTTYTYTSTDASFYHPSTMTDGNANAGNGGTTTTYSYDPTYQLLTRVCTPLPGGACGSTPTMPANVVTYTYGNSSHPGDLMSATNGDSKTTNYGYDTYGNLAEIQDPAGDVSATEFNAAGWKVVSWTPNGGCAFSTSLTNGQAPAGCSSTFETTDTYADTSGNDVFWPDVLKVSAPLSRTSTAVYDADNNVTQAVDFNGNPTTYAYDTAGELCWTLPGGTSTNGCGNPPANARVTDYTADGQLAHQKNGLGNALQSYAYDTRGNLTTLTVDPGSSPHLNQATTFTYDGNSNQLTKTDPGGSCTGNVSGCTTYAYNADNQVCWYLVGASANGCGTVPSGAVSYGYDSDGQRTAMSDGSSGSWSYAIDALHRLTSVTEGQGGGATATIGYQYNYRNEPTQITYPGTTGSVTIGYDTAGREHTVQDWNSQTTTFTYDADSNPTTTVFPGGSCTAPVSLCDTSTYNTADQLTGISDAQNSTTTIFAATYGRDGNGQVSSDSSATSAQNSYGYTALNQLCYAGSTNASACASPPSGSQPFVYDNGDNLTTFGGRTQSFNSADELCWTVTGTSANACADSPSGARAFNYDSRGNRTSAVPSTGSATCYSYSEASWLTQIQTGSGSTCGSPTTVASYVSNGDGLRMSKTVGTTTTRAAWDLSGTLPLQLVDGSTDYVYGPGGMVLEQVSGSTTVWYHHDQLGSVRAITDSSGNVKATYTFDPYGNVLACTGATVTVSGANMCTGAIAVANPFDFAGQYRDDESGLYYLRARYYEPATAQFLSRDPDVATTLSPYGYVDGNPLNATDPTGRCFTGSAACPDAYSGPMRYTATAFVTLKDKFGIPLTSEWLTINWQDTGGRVSNVAATIYSRSHDSGFIFGNWNLTGETLTRTSEGCPTTVAGNTQFLNDSSGLVTMPSYYADSLQASITIGPNGAWAAAGAVQANDSFGNTLHADAGAWDGPPSAGPSDQRGPW